MIDSFRLEYDFLSNFYPCKIPMFYYGSYNEDQPEVTFKSTEAAFQACKASTYEEFCSFKDLDASAAKKKGRQITLRNDWEKIKLDVMTILIRRKFYMNPELAKKLLATENEFLVEGNWWGDTFWGVCKGVGLNHLGNILMKVREELKEYN